MLLITTLISTTLAIVMSVIAWRATADQRRRSQARVAALSQAIHAGDDIDTFRPADGRSAEAFALHGNEESSFGARRLQPSDEQQILFAVPEESNGPRYAVALAAAGFVVASVAGAAIVFSGESPASTPATVPSVPSSSSSSSGASARAFAPAAAPLELLSLTHERDGGTLTVRGIVRNPEAGGVEADRLTAVVMLFDRDGSLLATGRSAVDAPALIPGGQAPFVVTVPATGQIGRYRVSFRSGDRIVSHVDKRGAS